MVSIKVLFVPLEYLMVLKLAIAVQVEGFEDLHQLLVLGIPEPCVVRYVGKDRLLHFLFDVYRMHVINNVLHHGLLELVRDMLLRDCSVFEDPLIIQSLISTDALVGIVGKHLLDEDLGLTGYHLPLRL